MNMEDLESDDSSSSWEDVDEEMENDANHCQPLLMNSLVLEKIFEFLPVCDLLSCRLVNREWNRTVLLRTLLGSKFEISVSKANFDRLLKTAQHSKQPFCRKFDFRLLDLEYDKVAKFIKLFGDRVNTLSIKFCTASSSQSVVKILNCPRLEELKIYGALPEIKEEHFHSFNFSRLRLLSLVSSLDYGQVSEQFIGIILRHAPNLRFINVGQSMSLWTDFCKAVSPTTCSKLCNIGLSGIEGPLQIDHFKEFHSKKLKLERVNFQNCLVGPTFLEQLLQQSLRNLKVINIEGTQQEILSRSFELVTLPNLNRLTLPIDGLSLSEGCFLLHSSPNLKTLTILGLFQTTFSFKEGNLLSIVISELKTLFQNLYTRQFGGNLHPAANGAIKREFLKVISVFQLQPQNLEVNLTVSRINSRCIRAIFNLYPDLKHFTFINNSVKECIVGFTGIPYRQCKKMASCKSFAVTYPDKVGILTSAAKLKKLRSLNLTLLDEAPSAELALMFIVYGICEMSSLKDLNLTNLMMSDVAYMILSQKLNLSSCRVNGSEKQWHQFQTFYRQHTIKSFLLPPPIDYENGRSPAELVGLDRNIMLKVFDYLSSNDIFEARKVCRYWQAISSEYLHQQCGDEKCFTVALEGRLYKHQQDRVCPPSPSSCFIKYFGETRVPAFSRVLKIWSSIKRETSLVIISLSRSALEFFQIDNYRPTTKRHVTCQKRRQLEYWYYPDGTDKLIYRPNMLEEKKLEGDFLEEISGEVETLLVIGCWGRRDDALLQFFNPSWSIGSIHLIGLQKDALDMVLPRMTVMKNLESLDIKPFINSTAPCELTKTHLQILCNASFNLRELALHLHAPSEAVVEFIRSQRFTLETIELRSNINISDRLTFLMPQLKILILDEPPGCLLWTTLNVHSSLETINFGRSGGNSYSQVKNKSSPKVNPVDADFEHSATELLCDINWFLENATSPRRTGAQKSILQQSSDSALKFFMHFPYLSSLTLRSVHAHYGILQGIFKKFGQLKKLELINATGVTDEILTGFSKEILDEMDIMNPFQVMRGKHKSEVSGKKKVSIRNLKCLTHLRIDDQPSCTDFSILFGILKLHYLEYFSCKKWKITDVSLRALADVLPSLKTVDTEGCVAVSKYATQYFDESRSLNRARVLTRSNSTSSSISRSSISEGGQSHKSEE